MPSGFAGNSKLSVLSFASRTTTASLAITPANDWAGVAASSVNKAPAFPDILLLRRQGVGMAAVGASRFPAPEGWHRSTSQQRDSVAKEQLIAGIIAQKLASYRARPTQSGRLA